MVHLRCVVHLSSSNILRRGGVEDVGVFVKPMARFKIPEGVGWRNPVFQKINDNNKGLNSIPNKQVQMAKKNTENSNLSGLQQFADLKESLISLLQTPCSLVPSHFNQFQLSRFLLVFCLQTPSNSPQKDAKPPPPSPTKSNELSRSKRHLLRGIQRFLLRFRRLQHLRLCNTMPWETQRCAVKELSRWRAES